MPLLPFTCTTWYSVAIIIHRADNFQEVKYLRIQFRRVNFSGQPFLCMLLAGVLFVKVSWICGGV